MTTTRSYSTKQIKEIAEEGLRLYSTVRSNHSVACTEETCICGLDTALDGLTDFVGDNMGVLCTYVLENTKE